MAVHSNERVLNEISSHLDIPSQQKRKTNHRLVVLTEQTIEAPRRDTVGVWICGREISPAPHQHLDATGDHFVAPDLIEAGRASSALPQGCERGQSTFSCASDATQRGAMLLGPGPQPYQAQGRGGPAQTVVLASL